MTDAAFATEDSVVLEASRGETLSPDDPVEVWNEFSRRWTSGFRLVARVVIGGFIVRRAGDEHPLPVALAAVRVRPLVEGGCPHDGDGGVSVGHRTTRTTDFDPSAIAR
jgi:hypothetical protein